MLDPEQLTGRRGVYAITSRRPFALGRMSALYEAASPSGEVVCAKVFRRQPGDGSSPSQGYEFLQELDAQTKLSHPNILPVLDFGRSAEGAEPFVIYPLCRGGSLRALMTQRPFLPVPEALPLLRQVAAAIDAAHASGFIHGDVKPENILFLEKESHPYLADFGIARHFPFVDRVSTAVAGPSAGTTAYLAPEQLADGHQSTRSDIYSFGIVAYEMLVGSLPFDQTAPLYRQIVAKVEGTLVDPLVHNPGLPRPAADALRAALRVDRTTRPDSATAFCRILSGEQQAPEVAGAATAAVVLPAGSRWSRLETPVKVAIVTASIATLGGLVTALINALLR